MTPCGLTVSNLSIGLCRDRADAAWTSVLIAVVPELAAHNARSDVRGCQRHRPRLAPGCHCQPTTQGVESQGEGYMAGGGTVGQGGTPELQSQRSEQLWSSVGGVILRHNMHMNTQIRGYATLV